jgi:hypothetical protein
MLKSKRQKRDLFAAATSGFSIRICELRPDGSLRALLWSKLTSAERKRGEEFVKLLAPDPKTLACDGACAWSSPNRPKSAEVATALGEFVTAIEHRHGAEVWVR